MPATANKLTREDQQVLSRLISMYQTDGVSESTPVDRDFLLQDGNYDLFFLNYFPNDFQGFEKLNYELLDFLEHESQGMAWLPGGHGKALAVATPILTTNGWKTMAEIQVGDYVYGSDGKPTLVVYTSDIETGHPCYELTFGDGAKIVADAEHLWNVWDEYATTPGVRGAWRTYTTQQMVDKGYRRNRKNGQVGYRFKVRCDITPDFPEADLPIDPYVFGYWLGDGHSDCARITCGDEDLQHILSEIEDAGYKTNVGKRPSWPGCTAANTVGFNIGAPVKDGFMSRIKRLGVWNNKHIPDIYLRSSREQRLALLAGLLDSDGTVNRGGRVDFSVISKCLSYDVHKLVRSLGERATVTESVARLNGRTISPRYHVSWSCTFNPFRLPRKAAKWKPPMQKREWMSLVKVERVPSVPTCCIKVSNEDGIFLAGELLTPTHNTTTLLHWMVYVMCREPQISFIYCEKSEPAASQRARALMDILEFNEKLVHDFGEFKSRWWSANAITIKQRPIISQWPTVAFFGAQSKAVLGSRTNIMIVDDPVTADNSSSELERIRLRDWYSQAAATCPYPLPLKNEQYLRKLFLVGTTFHMDDLYHTVQKTGMYKQLWLKAVDMKTGETLSPRFTYRTRKELEATADSNQADAELLEKVKQGKVISLLDFRNGHGTRAFMRRYQNEVQDDSMAKFPNIWFTGGEGEWAPPGGYPGCIEDGERHLGRSLGERPDTKGTLTCVTGVDPAAGTKGAYTVRFACVSLGCDIANDPNTVYLLDLDFGQQPMVSDNASKESQMDVVLQHVKNFGGRVILEVNNVQGVWAQALRQEASRRGTDITITGHHTSHSKKVDPQQGIEAMAAMIENGHLRLPYKMPTDRKKIDELIEEFVYWGVYPTDDILMAFWFAWRALERIKRNRRTTPPPRREIPAYRDIGDRFIFPPHWSEQRKLAYLGLTTEEETDGEDD